MPAKTHGMTGTRLYTMWKNMRGRCYRTTATHYDRYGGRGIISYQEALRRDATRGIFSVGEKVLAKQWEMWVKYWEDKGGGMWDNQRMEGEDE